MAWPEREIEERLYEIPDVLAARVSDEQGSLHVGVLVRPTTDTEGLPAAILDRIQAVAGAVPESIDLRVMPLGSTAETRTVRAGTELPVMARAGRDMPEPEPATPPVVTGPSADAQGSDAMTPDAMITDAMIPDAPRASTVSSRSTPIVGVHVAGQERTVLARVTATQEGPNFAAEVELRLGDRSSTGRAEGLATRIGTQRLVAEATISALDALDGDGPQRRGLDFVDVLASAGGEIAVVGVVTGDASVDQMVTGSASVRGGNRLDAVARAVLDATNRRR
jgi:hypothetical protein